MSYDVYLEGPSGTGTCVCEACGDEHKRARGETLFSRNHTSNTSEMWCHAGAPLHAWDGRVARELVDPLGNAIADMEGRPDFYQQWAPANGWGTVYSTIKFLRDILAACRAHPRATMRISR